MFVLVNAAVLRVWSVDGCLGVSNTLRLDLFTKPTKRLGLPLTCWQKLNKSELKREKQHFCWGVAGWIELVSRGELGCKSRPGE